MILRHCLRSIKIEFSCFFIIYGASSIASHVIGHVVWDSVWIAFRSRRSYSCLRQLWSRFCLRKFRVYLRLFAITHVDLLENDNFCFSLSTWMDSRVIIVSIFLNRIIVLFYISFSHQNDLFVSDLVDLLNYVLNCFKGVNKVLIWWRFTIIMQGTADRKLIYTEIVIRALERRLCLSTYQIRCLSRPRSCWIQFFRIVSGNTTSIR